MKKPHTFKDNTPQHTSHILRQTMLAYFLIGGIHGMAYATEQGYKFGVGDDCDKGSFTSYMMTGYPNPNRGNNLSVRTHTQMLGVADLDQGSTLEWGMSASQRLDDFDEIREYMFKGYLEITPDNHLDLLNFAQTNKEIFKTFDRGVCVKQWKASIEQKQLIKLLLSFSRIDKFTFEMLGDGDATDMSGPISRGVQFYQNLTELTLAGCKLDDKGMDDIIESIRNPGMITALDIRDNNLTNDSIQKIMETFVNLNLSKFKTDVTLAVLDTGAVKKTTLQKQEALEQTKTLQEMQADLNQQKIIVETLRNQLDELSTTAEKLKMQLLEADNQHKLEAEAAAAEIEKLKKKMGNKLITESQLVSVEKPIASTLPIPEIARGYGDIYRRFINGKLIYRPTPGSDLGIIELPITDFLTRGQDPLASEFDLSHCGDASTYLSINTGYKKWQIPSNENKLEIWITSRFIIKNQLNSTAAHYKPMMSQWTENATFGIFFSWGSCDNLMRFDPIINIEPNQLILNNLVEILSMPKTKFHGGISQLPSEVNNIRHPARIELHKFKIFI